jgi:hypothetical protein
MERFSRREFFKKLTPKFNKEAEEVNKERDVYPSEIEKYWTRRDFIKFIIGLSGAILLTASGIGVAKGKDSEKEIKQQQKTKENFIQRSQIIETINQEEQEIKRGGTQTQEIEEKIDLNQQQKIEEVKDSYAKTIIESNLLLAADIIAIKTLNALGIDHTKPIDKEELERIFKNTSISDVIAITFAGPLSEETIFRLLPSKIIDYLSRNKNSHWWEVGIPISFLFAFAHNLDFDEEGLKFQKAIPLSQFMGGLFYWYLMRERGFSHAVLAHSTHNATILAIGKLLYKIFPPKK